MRNGSGLMADDTRQLVVDQQYRVRNCSFEYYVTVIALLPGDAWSANNARVRTMGGWDMLIHGYHLYDDNTVDWDYSTGGRFIYEEV